MENKELKKDELNEVNGGKDDTCHSEIKCPYCGHWDIDYKFELKTSGSGCNTIREFKCPGCGQWFEH